MNLDQQIFTLSGEQASVISAYFFFVVTFVLMPCGLIYLMKSPLSTIQNSRKFNRKWKAFYQGIKTRSKWTLAYYSIFYVRRVNFCFLALFLKHLPIIILQINMLLNLFIIIYQGSICPFITRQQNRIELFNEVFITIITFHLCLFTQFVPEYEVQIKMGWSLIFFTVVLSLGNFMIILREGFRSIYLVFVKYYRRGRRYLDSDYMRKEKIIDDIGQ